MLTFQLIVSALIVFAVLWWMWRMPAERGQSLFAWAPPLALLSVWVGLAAVVCTGLLWVVTFPDAWLVMLFLLMDPAALASAVLVLWTYRGSPENTGTVALQRQQAWVGIGLSLLAITAGYGYVMTHKSLFTPVGT